MSRTTVLLMSLGGADAPALARGLVQLGLAPAAPATLEVDGAPKKPAMDWAGTWTGTCRTLTAMTDDGHSLTLDRAGGLVTLRHPRVELAAPDFFRRLGALPFELAVIGQVYQEWWDEDYPTVSFGDGHVPHGWACAFRGAGRSRLVSPRWLEFGPWRTREIGDATWVEFHPLEADPAAALALARPAWARMGISDEGGFIQTGFVYQDDVGGVYDAATRTLKVIVPRGGEISQRKMLEMAAVRGDPRIPASQAIERVAFVFVDEADARRHLHELWLRGHACLAIVDGVERRLDEGYAPQPQPPAWVARG